MSTRDLLASVADPQAFMDELCRRDFVSFFLRAFPIVRGGRPVLANWHIDAIARALEGAADGTTRELLVTLPPRHLKSLMISVAWVAWMLGHDPSLRFVCASYSGKLAAKHGRDTRLLMQSEWYRRLFPRTRISSDRTAADDFDTTAAGGRLATSITGTLTGRGGDFIIVDDPLKPDEATSEVAREAANEWFFSTLSSRLDRPMAGAIIVVMQRLHQYDLGGMLIERGWSQLCIPAIATEAVSVPLTRGRTYSRAEGEVLHSAWRPIEELLAKKATIGSRLFAAQYQQDPVPAKGDIVKAHWLLEYDIPPTREGGGFVVQSWDTASKDEERNDYSVCVTALVRGRKVHVLDVWRQKVQFHQLWHVVQRLAREHNAQSLLIEDTGNGTALLSRLWNVPPQGVCSPIARRPKLGKIGRLEAASTMIEAGDLILPKDAHWLATFKSELLGFPSTRHDDQVDALSQLMNWVDERQKQTIEIQGPITIDLENPDPRWRLDYDFDPWAG